jgi:signal peptidase
LPNLTSIAVIVLVLVLGWPAKWGGQSTIVIVGGHSMEPAYRVGYLVAAWNSVPEEGDIAVFRVPEGRVGGGIEVIHRIVEVEVVGGNRVYRTQGDANTNPDPWDLTDADIVGVAVFHVPFAGVALRVIGHPAFLALAAGALTLLMLWPKRMAHPEEAPAGVPVDPGLADRMRELLTFRSEGEPRGRHLAPGEVDPDLADRMRALLTFRSESGGRHLADGATDPDRREEPTTRR